MRTIRLLGLVLVGLAFLTACQKNDDALTTDAVKKNYNSSVECVTFANVPAGTIVSTAFTDMGSGPIGVFGTNPNDSSKNAAMIFDSDAPTGGDPDLGTPNQDFNGPGVGVGGKAGATYQNDKFQNEVLIVTEDWDSGDPDDLRGKGEFDFDFTAIGPVKVHSLTLIDIEGAEGSPIVSFYDAAMNLISSVALPTTGDNGLETVSFAPAMNVSFMTVELGGSGAIDDLCIELPPPPPSVGCTHTIGYWKNHAGIKKQPDMVSQYLTLYLGDGTGKTLAVTNKTIAVDVLKQNVYGKASNGITKLYAQLLAAKLSIADGADGTPVNTIVTNADTFLAMYDYMDWKSLSKNDQNQVLAWKDALDHYNNGYSGVTHCE